MTTLENKTDRELHIISINLLTEVLSKLNNPITNKQLANRDADAAFTAWIAATPPPKIFSVSELITGALGIGHDTHANKRSAGEYLRAKGFRSEQTYKNGVRTLVWKQGLDAEAYNKIEAWLKENRKPFIISTILTRALNIPNDDSTKAIRKEATDILKSLNYTSRKTTIGNVEGTFWSYRGAPDSDFAPSRQKTPEERDAMNKYYESLGRSKPQPANSNIIIDTDWGDDDEDLDDLV